MPASKDPHTCSANVHNGYGAGFHQCCRGIAVTVNEKGYCTQHAPEVVKARNAARRERDLARRAQEKWEWKLHELERDVLRAAKGWCFPANGFPAVDSEDDLFQAVEALVWHERQNPETKEPQVAE